MHALRERPYLLGPNESMLGIAAEPVDASSASSDDRPFVVVLNAGIVHRVGPHRMSVAATRALAQMGFRAMRVDLSGIGDSAPRRDSLGFEAGAQADVGELLDDLGERVGAKTFVLMGLCSGADNSFYAALDDPRIVGAVLLDGIAYRTPRYYVEKYREKVARPSAWVSLGKRAAKLARRRVEGVVGQRFGGGAGDADSGTDAIDEAVAAAPPAVPDYVRDFEPREVVCQKFQTLCDRGVKSFWVYTAGAQLYYNYETQFFDMFKEVDFKNVVEYRFFSDSNHTFTEVAAQRDLVAAIANWAASAFPAR